MPTLRPGGIFDARRETFTPAERRAYLGGVAA